MDADLVDFANKMSVEEHEFERSHQQSVDFVLRSPGGISNMLIVELRGEDGNDAVHMVAIMAGSRPELLEAMFSAGVSVAEAAPKTFPRVVSHIAECWTRAYDQGEQQPERLHDLSKDPLAGEAIVVTTVAILRTAPGQLETRAVSTMFRFRREGDRLVYGDPEKATRCEPRLLLRFFNGFMVVNDRRIAIGRASTPSAN